MITPKIIGNDCLILNSDGLPLSITPISTCSWKEAVTSVYLDQVVALNYHENWVVHSATQEFQVPSVIMHKTWSKKSKAVKYSKTNVFLRDRHTCQYCGVQFARHELTVDHWIPKVDGGDSTWDNILSACRECNGAKGHHRTGWTPLNMPRKPTYGELSASAKSIPIAIPDLNWNLYLGWPDHLVTLLKR